MFRSAPSPLLRLAIVSLAMAIFIVDTFTPLDIAIAVMYVVVVMLAGHAWQRTGLLAVVAGTMVLTMASYLATHTAMFSGPALGRCLVSLAAIGITGFLALAGQRANNALRQREESLRRSEAFLAGTQRISRTGSFSYDVATGAMSWSDEAARIYGYDAAVTPTIEVVLARVLPADAHIVRAAFAQCNAGLPSIDVRHRLLMQDGAIRHLHVLARATVNSDGHPEYLCALMDVSAAHAAEHALHRSQLQLAHVTRVTTLGELAASIAHEVNQPLAAIAMNGDACLRWMNRAEPDLDEARIAVTRILEASRRASAVIQRIRALARKSEPQHLPLDLNDVAQESAALVRRELASHNVALTLDLAAALPAVQGDRVQLQQVIINLLINGMQAMEPAGGGTLIMRSAPDQGGVLLSVSDNGPGIAPDDLGRLFEAFFTTKADGMGMGLPICRSIIESHGGRIAALAQAAPGATIQFCLPLPEHAA